MRQHASACPPRRVPATRTSSPSRSPHPTAPSTWRTPTSTTRSPARRTATRCCWPAPPTAAPRFTAPVRVGYYNELPDCATYQNGADPGRACVPEKGPSANSIFRASNYPIGAVDPTDAEPGRGHLRLVHQPQLQREPTGCTPAGFAADGDQPVHRCQDGGCNNDISTAVSDQRRQAASRRHHRPTATCRWSPTAPGQARTDQFWQGAAFTPNGTLVAVSYYDRQYGADNNTGFSDITVSAVAQPDRPSPTTGPPPPACRHRPSSRAPFYGDYAGIAVTNTHGLPGLVGHPARSTCSCAPAPEPPPRHPRSARSARQRARSPTTRTSTPQACRSRRPPPPNDPKLVPRPDHRGTSSFPPTDGSRELRVNLASCMSFAMPLSSRTAAATNSSLSWISFSDNAWLVNPSDQVVRRCHVPNLQIPHRRRQADLPHWLPWPKRRSFGASPMPHAYPMSGQSHGSRSSRPEVLFGRNGDCSSTRPRRPRLHAAACVRRPQPGVSAPPG